MFDIRKAIAADAEKLPEIERSAGAAFLEDLDLKWIADDDVQSVERHLELIDWGAAWVATDASGEPVGFLSAEVTANTLHIWELAVRNDLQGRGMGRALIERARLWAVDQGIGVVTLTTFRGVPWNEPFYRSIGFRTLGSHEFTPFLACTLAAEISAGLPAEKRCAMVLAIG